MNYYKKGIPDLNRDRRNQNTPNEERPGRGRRMPEMTPMPQMPGMEGPRVTPPGFPPTGPGMGEAPRTAPPSFTPELPESERRQMEQRPMGRGPEFGEPFMFGPQFQPERRRRFRGCMNRFTFIWLINGNSFWFYPTFIDGQFVYGFRWRVNRWEFDRINLNRIIYFRCF
jgi:hypothetical protein